MLIKLLFIIAIIIQTVAIIFALRLVRVTKYNAIWILFILGFLVLSVERYMQLINYNGGNVPLRTFYFTGFVVSIGLSIGVMYAHKLFLYINRLNHQRTLTSKRILSAVIRTEEKSRARFSKDLHDGLGPLLSSAKLSLSAMEHAKSKADHDEIIKNTKYLIDEAIRSLREISNNMSPHILIDFGLNRAISNFINKNATLNTSKIRFKTNLKDQRYNSDVEVILYRVICELINNSLKHSKCSRINISLQVQEEMLHLNYNDNGCGFNPESTIDYGMGLSNITSRINSINGSFDIISSIGKGMNAAIRINIKGKILDV